MLSKNFRKQRTMYIDKAIVPLIKEVCVALDKYSPEAVQLLLGTAAAESSLIYRTQIGGGPARGLWQMESRTAIDIFGNYIYYRKILYNKLLSIWLDLSSDVVSDISNEVMIWIGENGMAHHLQSDDAFACAMARVHYLRVPARIPTTLDGQAKYWLRFYNAGGKGSVDHYLSQWEACGCGELLNQ